MRLRIGAHVSDVFALLPPPGRAACPEQVTAPPWPLPSSCAMAGSSLEETGLAVIACRVLGQRVHPVTGAAMTYLACDAGEACERVSVGFFGPVQDFLDAALRG